MKILILNTIIFNNNGMAFVIKDYYEAMDKTDMEIDFLTTKEPSDEFKRWFKENNLKYFVVNKSNPLKYVLKLKKIAKAGNYDLVHIHGNSANMAFELLGCKLGGIKRRLTHVHNTTTDHPVMHTLLYPLFSALYTDALACGQDAGKWLYGNKPFIELKNGRDIDKFSYNPQKSLRMKEQLGLKDKLVIGHIGGFHKQKNHTFLIDICKSACETREDIHFLLLGDGVLRKEIEAKAKNLGVYDKITFTGPVNNPEDYLQAMDAAVLPSLYEGLPLVAVEWQINGLPCVLADTVTPEAALCDFVIFLSLDDSPEKWAELLIQSAENSDREKNALYAVDRVREAGFDIKQSAEVLRNIYVEKGV